MSELIFTKAGNSMLSGNPINFEVAIAPYNYDVQKDTVFMIISIALEISPGSFTEVKSQKVYPDALGMVAFDVSSIIDAYLQYFTPPAGLDKLTEAKGQAKRFKIKCSLFDSLVLITEQSVIINAIKAGAAYQYFNSGFSYNFQDGNTPPLLLFITDGKDVVAKEDLFFIYFTRIALAPARVFVNYKINYLLGDDYAFITGQADAGFNTASNLNVYCMPAGFNQLNLQSYLPNGAVAISYAITIMGNNGSADVPLLAPLTFTIEQRNFYKTTQLLYRNSLGGLQPLRLFGQIDYSADYVYQQVNKIAPPSYLQDGNIIGQSDQQYSEETLKYSGETGFITPYPGWQATGFFSKQTTLSGYRWAVGAHYHQHKNR